MNPDTLLIYSVVSFFYIITPGPAILLAVSNGLNSGLRALLMSSLGNISGLFVLSLASIMGLGALMAASSDLFTLAKFLGAGYLIYLGIRQLLRTPRSFSIASEQATETRRASSGYFLEGFILAISNPKAILFFTALYPQFLDYSSAMLPQYVSMTGLFMAISFASLCSWGILSHTAKRHIGTSRGLKWFHRISGSLFIGVGIGLTQLKHT